MKELNIEKILWMIFLTFILSIIFVASSFGQLNIKKRNITVTENLDVGDTTTTSVLLVGNGVPVDSSMTIKDAVHNAEFDSVYTVKLKFDDGTSMTTATGAASDTNETIYTRYLNTDFSAISATLADVPGLNIYVESGEAYHVEYKIFMSADVTGGITVGTSASGAPTSSLCWGSSVLFNLADETIPMSAALNSYGWSYSTSGSDSGYFLEISLTIVTTSTGLLKFQFAQETANGTSYVKAGSYVKIIKEN